MRELKGITGWAVSAIAILMALFHLYSAAFGTLVALHQRSIHLAFALALAYLLYPASKTSGREKPSFLDILLAGASVIVISYVAFIYEEITLRMTFITPMSYFDIVFGGLAIFLVIEAGRRVLGLPLAIICLLALVFAYTGSYLPGIFAHRGFTPLQIIDYLYLGYDGIFGMPLGVSATYLVLFIIFGAFMEKSGTGLFIMDFARSLTGRSRGGPAKVAVVSSALFGMVSGAAVANVYSTGTFTIPLMKRSGYKASFAGAVEAVASTGGQLMPPILGAAAFIMADWIGIPYLQIARAAIIPALLYFLAVGVIVHLEAVKTDLKGISEEEILPLKGVLRNLHLMFPLVVLVGVMMAGYSIFRSAFVGIIAAFLISLVRKETRLGPRGILGALELGAKRAVTMAVATSCAGIIVGVFTLTGVGLNLTGLVVTYFQDALFIALICTMVASIILGMGVPTVVAYILVGTLAAPILIKLGVPVLTAHMFVFSYGIVAMITPPIAIASWAGAEIAGADYTRTGINAVKLGLVAFIVPYMFIYGPPLLGIGSPIEVIAATFTAIIGVLSLAGGLQGWLLRATPLWQRLLLFVAGFLLISFGLMTDLVGMGLFALVLGAQKRRVRQAGLEVS